MALLNMKGNVFLFFFFGACLQPSEGLPVKLKILGQEYEADCIFEADTHKGVMRIYTSSLDSSKTLKAILISEKARNLYPRSNDYYTFMTASDPSAPNTGYRNVYGVTKIRDEATGNQHSVLFHFSWIAPENGHPLVYAIYTDDPDEFLCYGTINLEKSTIDIRKTYQGISSSPPIKLDPIQKKIKKIYKTAKGGDFLSLVGPLKEGMDSSPSVHNGLQRHYITGLVVNKLVPHYNVVGEKHLTYTFSKIENNVEMHCVEYIGSSVHMDGVVNEDSKEITITISQDNYFTTVELLRDTKVTLLKLKGENENASFVSINGPWKTHPNKNSDSRNAATLSNVWRPLPNLSGVFLSEDGDGNAAELVLKFSLSPKSKYVIKIEGDLEDFEFIGHGILKLGNGDVVIESHIFETVEKKDDHLSELERSLNEVVAHQYFACIWGPWVRGRNPPNDEDRSWLAIDDVTWTHEVITPAVGVTTPEWATKSYSLTLQFKVRPEEHTWQKDLYAIAFGQFVFAGTYDGSTGDTIIWPDFPPNAHNPRRGVELTPKTLAFMKYTARSKHSESSVRISGPLPSWPRSIHSLQWTKVTMTDMADVNVEGKDETKIKCVLCKCSDLVLLKKEKKFAALILGLTDYFPVTVNEKRREIIIQEIYPDGNFIPLISLDDLQKELLYKAKDVYKKITSEEEEISFVRLSKEPMADVSKCTAAGRRMIYGVARIERTTDELGIPILKFLYSTDSHQMTLTMGLLTFPGLKFMVQGAIYETDDRLELEVRMKYFNKIHIDSEMVDLKSISECLDPTLPSDPVTLSKPTEPTPSNAQSPNLKGTGASSKIPAAAHSGESVSNDALGCAGFLGLYGPFQTSVSIALDEAELQKAPQKLCVYNVRYTDYDIPLLTMDYRKVSASE